MSTKKKIKSKKKKQKPSILKIRTNNHQLTNGKMSQRCLSLPQIHPKYVQHSKKHQDDDSNKKKRNQSTQKISKLVQIKNKITISFQTPTSRINKTVFPQYQLKDQKLCIDQNQQCSKDKKSEFQRSLQKLNQFQQAIDQQQKALTASIKIKKSPRIQLQKLPAINNLTHVQKRMNTSPLNIKSKSELEKIKGLRKYSSTNQLFHEKQASKHIAQKQNAKSYFEIMNQKRRVYFLYQMIQQLWLDIKAHNLPAMDIENQKLINEFKEVHFQILSGEKWKIKTFTHLRATIQSRIQQIDSYYQENINDPTIHFAQKIKLKLKQALHLRLRNPQGPVEYIQPPADLHRSGIEAFAATNQQLKSSQFNEKNAFGKESDAHKRKEADQSNAAVLHSKMVKSKNEMRQDKFQKLSPVRKQQGGGGAASASKKHQQPGQNSKSASNSKAGGSLTDVFRIQLTPQQYKIFLAKKQISMAKQGFNTQQIQQAISNLQISAHG